MVALLLAQERFRERFMKAKPIIFGVIVGFLVMGLIVWFAMPVMMINVHESRYGFEETVAAVEESVTSQKGWKVAEVFDIQKNIVNAGYKDMTNVKIVAVCNAGYAHRILDDDKDKGVTTMMPLGIGVYETKDGNVYMSEMNVGLVGKVFGGTISEVMGDASADISRIIADVSVK